MHITLGNWYKGNCARNIAGEDSYSVYGDSKQMRKWPTMILCEAAVKAKRRNIGGQHGGARNHESTPTTRLTRYKGTTGPPLLRSETALIDEYLISGPLFEPVDTAVNQFQEIGVD